MVLGRVCMAQVTPLFANEPSRIRARLAVSELEDRVRSACAWSLKLSSRIPTQTASIKRPSNSHSGGAVPAAILGSRFPCGSDILPGYHLYLTEAHVASNS